MTRYYIDDFAMYAEIKGILVVCAVFAAAIILGLLEAYIRQKISEYHVKKMEKARKERIERLKKKGWEPW